VRETVGQDNLEFGRHIAREGVAHLDRRG